MTKHRQAGLTLIEMMITVGVIAVLAAVAWPLYDEQQRAGRRADAIIGLSKLAYALESFKSDTGDYTQADMANYIPDFDTAAEATANPTGCIKRGFTGVGSSPLAATDTFTTCRGYYTLTITNIVAPSAGVDTSFLLTATPIANRDQALDECASFTLNNIGVKGATRQSGAATLPTGVTAVKRCWGSD